MAAQRLARWAARALAGAALCAVIASIAAAAPEDAGSADAQPVIRITAARFIKTDEEVAPPSTDPRWKPVELPDNWQKSNPGEHGYGWYAASFQVAVQPVHSWGVYLPSIGTSYQIFINGIEAGTSGGMRGRFRRTMGVPQFDPIAPQIIVPGDNALLLRLRVASNLRGGLAPVYIGPGDLLEPMHERDYFWRVTLPRALNVALVFAGLLVSLLWLRRRSESLYGYFAALAVLWSLRNFHYTVSLGAVPARVWEAFILGSLGLVLLLLLLFMLRFTGQRRSRLERAAAVICLAAPLVFLVLSEQLVALIRPVWYLVCVALGVAVIQVLLAYLRSPGGRRHGAAWMILAALLVTLALGLSDLAVSLGFLPFGPAARMAFGAPILLTTLTLALADSYFRTFDQVRQLNEQLEQRVVERTAELENTHQRLRSLERNAVLAGERDRLMRDLHDGVGSQLMTTLSSLERGQLDAAGAARLMRECIDDLRLVIDSLEPDEQSLQTALGNLRWRLEPRLASAGLTLDWAVNAPHDMAPGTVLQLLRIVQEALANSLKHAGATRLRVAVSPRQHAGGIRLEVTDDGHGFEGTRTADAQAGRGLRNMHLRAMQLGAHLQVQSSPQGTVVTVDVPA
jgi:signal transduction histidine kinase